MKATKHPHNVRVMEDSGRAKAMNDQLEGPELIVGLVGAVGADLETLCRELEECLRLVNYSCTTIRMIEAVHGLPRWTALEETPHDRRIITHMDAGDQLRESLGRSDALALLAIAAIRAEREKATGEANSTLKRHAYVLRSLKNPAEVSILREIYGSAFILIAGYAPRETRLEQLALAIARSYQSFQSEFYRARAEQLIYRDQSDQDNKFGQNVRGTFPLADFFVDISRTQDLRSQLQRFIEIIFGHPFHTPSRDEYAMFHAKAAALRSSDLGRQVGAVVSTTQGDIVAVGTNEVPRAGGGLYWPGDEGDGRNFKLGYEPSDRFKKMTLGDILQRLRTAGWLNNDKTNLETEALVDAALAGEGGPGLAKGAHLMNSIEYIRAVHAEMASITDASRRGVGLQGCTIYSTTFPCHDCAKHIVASGLTRVVYVEPYAKSLASELYPDSISIDSADETPNQVRFEPFVGIAPQRYFDLFEMVDRKQEDGRLVNWNGINAKLRLSESPLVYLARESAEIFKFDEELDAVGLRKQAQEEAR